MKAILAALALAACLCAQQSNAPNYTAGSIVNGASFTPGLAPNTIISVFGTNLAWGTTVLTPNDMSAGYMPTTLGNVQAYFGGWPAYLYYVSPTQINLLVPSSLLPGVFQFWVDRQGIRGPIVTVTLQDVAPGLFQLSASEIVATHAEGAVICSDAPARPGEIVVLWATGLGTTDPALVDGALPSKGQRLSQISQFGILINGAALDPASILYAGVAPGYAGLYQINVRLPDTLPPNPELRLKMEGQLSAPALILPAK